MKSEHLLARTLKEMMSKQSLDKISVLELSKRCNISRKTFYYHYHDLYDLLAQVYLDEKIPNAEKTKGINELVDIVWDYYLKNQKFVDATFASAGKDLFFEFIYNLFYQRGMVYLSKYSGSMKLTLDSKKSLARFYASGYAHSITYYLSTYKNKTYRGLVKCVNFIDPEVVISSINNAAKLEKK